MMMEEDLSAVFTLPLSAQAYDEIMQLQSHLENLEYDDASNDSWSLIWGASYSSRRFYTFAFSGIEAHPYYKILWKS